MRTLFVLGSLGQGWNRELTHRAAAHFGAGSDLAASLGELPFFDPTLPEPPATVRRLRQAIVRADAVFFVCPEYGHSLPGVLKNAVDWVIGSGELERKVVAVTASVPDPTRGRRGLAALRQTLGAVSARVVWDEPIVRGTEDDSLPRIQAALEAAAREVNAERIVAYMHPTCSKSRAAKAWLEARGLVAEIRDYLTLGPTRAELEDLLRYLGTPDPRVLSRSTTTPGADAPAQLEAIVHDPELLQRPIVVRGERAVVARPAAELERLFGADGSEAPAEAL